MNQISLDKLPETYEIYRIKSDSVINDFGEMANPDPNDTTNYYLVGTIKARVNTGDSLEPDVRGVYKSYGTSISSMWLAWFQIPDGFELYEGDMIISTIDNTRKFFIQYLDRMPGGVSGHHYEARIQTTSVIMDDRV